MNKRSKRNILLTLGTLLLGACASAPPAPDAPLQLKLDSQLAAPQRAVLPGLNSDFTLGSSDGFLQYRAGYRVQPGQLFESGTSTVAAPSQQVALQTLGQNADVRLSELAGAPLRLGISYEQRSEWQLAGEAQNAQQAVNLGWAPPIAAFDLKWSNSTAPAAPLDCALEGTMQMPLPAEALALNLRGRSCRVVLPDASVAGLDARTWSAALEWGAQARRSQLRLQAIDPVPVAGAGTSDPAAGYELGLMRKHDLGPWSAQTQFAWRRAPDAQNPALAEGWSSDASLRRQLRGVGLSAGLASGVNPAWFLPDAAQRSNQLNLGLDLSRWAGGLLPGMTPETGLFYSHTRSIGTEESFYDDMLQWKFSLLLGGRE
ncbi:hypothetical protein D0B54_02170 [Solimonas sp. K1W22B-7]|uniref:hypothetical protein n=1 Tax=Solimonas sp. K1W22B-7 TaxID=2303331 RepID=UPI000E331F6B|nr:hypothetical protein [Solimonas sp. K1W22B-7]AXQ27555.1 hypothetical protein D0B54_02170 [Solimonas sp. K1W22B-7]